MTRQEYKDIYDVVGAERYLFLPEDDNFVLLTQENYKLYIDE